MPTLTNAPYHIYTDGGCIGRNPSPHGGTWCYVQLNSNKHFIRHNCGIVRPFQAQLKTISNNYTELLAVLRALESVPEGWDGTICTDSYVTLRRITTGQRFAGIPKVMEDRIRYLRKVLHYKAILVGGHPTKRELLAGQRRDGTPVSKWNQYCDERCRELAEQFLCGIKENRR